jgi:FAD-dependent oxidoreductase domain-containing protein 1
MQTSVVIVGGGVMGSATAYHLTRQHGANVTVLERDLSFRSASSALSASSMRQQFSTPVNIALSQASLVLMQPWLRELAFVEAGYLYLAGDTTADALAQANSVQRAHGADVRLMDARELKQRWPWLDVHGIALGSWGARGEGWFDGPALHQRFRREAQAHGARFVQANVMSFVLQNDRVLEAIDTSGHAYRADAFVIAAGAWSAPLAAHVGVALPVQAKKRDVFVLESPAALPGCPLIIDPSGIWMRPEGTGFLAGAPPRGQDPSNAPLDTIDHAMFDHFLWPTLAQRIPAFEALRVRSAWAGYYEMNTFDHNGLVGPLPGWSNAFTACGFSGHGMQQAPAVGRGLARFMVHGEWGAVDLSPLCVERIAKGHPLFEANVI